ncbi:MAG: CPBP family intramembrane metalloprotease [Acetatifactor sp.]|nr:CPBP family intramembrane metalloprotease [Acetatifactor sp.]
METNKEKRKKLYKSLAVFLFFAFVLVYVPTLAFVAKKVPYMLDVTLSDGTVESRINPAVNFLLTFSMLCPAIAMLLARLICKEGYAFHGEGSMMLGMVFRDKKWIWYLAALILPSIYTEAATGTILLMHPECFDSAQVQKLGLTPLFLVCYPFMGMLGSAVASVGALGEEAGWRGYMMPRLEKLFGTAGAVIIGGIIWGAWHYPDILLGHCFGHDYLLEPWSGFAVFTLFTIAANAFCHMIVKKTGSIWPAVFFHAANNGVCSVAQLYLAMDRVQGILPGNLKLCGALLQMAYMSILLLLMSYVDRRTNSIIDSTT